MSAEPRPTETTAEGDPLVRQLRRRLSDTDRAIVELVNRRLELVHRIRRRKEELDAPFLDPEREQWMLRYLLRANRGPLSGDGLTELHAELLALTKRELAAPERD